MWDGGSKENKDFCASPGHLAQPSRPISFPSVPPIWSRAGLLGSTALAALHDAAFAYNVPYLRASTTAAAQHETRLRETPRDSTRLHKTPRATRRARSSPPSRGGASSAPPLRPGRWEVRRPASRGGTGHEGPQRAHRESNRARVEAQQRISRQAVFAAAVSRRWRRRWRWK